LNKLVRRHYKSYFERKNRAINPKITCSYLKAWHENRNEIPILREARALKRFWENVDLQLYPDEIVVGKLLHHEPAMFHYGGGTYVDHHAAKAYITQENLSDSEADKLMAILDEIDGNRYIPGDPRIFTQEEMASIESTAATSTFFGGHLVMDYERILTLGLDGIAEEINNHSQKAPPDRQDFYEALRTVLEGIQILIERYAEKAFQISRTIGKAPEKSEYPEVDSKRLKSLGEDLKHIAHRPPRTFKQALQMVWMVHLVSDFDSLGRFDQYLYPYFKEDIEGGRLDIDTALIYLESLWIKIDEANAIQNMTIGGVDTEGKPAYNELTSLTLAATREMGFAGPNLCLRVDESMPEELWEEAWRCLGTGQGLPALYNDRIIIDYLLKAGILLEDARNYALGGCSQVNIPGRSNFVNDIGAMNILKCLELTYMNGVNPQNGKKTGLQTGEVESFNSFEEFMEAFRQQIRYFCKLEADINNKDIAYRREKEGYSVRTLFTSNCIEKGLGVYHGGAFYNNVQLECMGITNTADSLMAIKKAVFDEGIVTFRGLINALEANFKGYEQLKSYLINQVPKFGNDNEEVDALRAEISKLVFDELRHQRGIAGGIYVPGEVIFVAHEWTGNAVGATPDGRLAGEVLADSAGAVQGLDKKGPTALMNSVLRIPNDEILTSIILNIKFLKNIFLRVHKTPPTFQTLVYIIFLLYYIAIRCWFTSSILPFACTILLIFVFYDCSWEVGFMFEISGFTKDFDLSNFEDNTRDVVVNCSGYYRDVEGSAMQCIRRSGRKDYLVMYCAAGSEELLDNESRYTLGQGWLCIYKPHEPQYLHFNMNHSEVYWTHFTGLKCNEILNQCGMSEDRLYYIGENIKLVKHFKRLTEEIILKRAYYEDISASILQNCLYLAGRMLREQELGVKGTTVDKILNIIEMINLNYKEKITLDSLASTAHMSKYSFIRHFKNYTGYTPIDYLIRVRIQRAKEIMERGNATVKAVALEVGYDNPFYFSRLFKKYEGISPEEFLKPYNY
jgi:pyruvate-formate lyase/AraC-like DNA-binding protein